jgi:hypothetical protein
MFKQICAVIFISTWAMSAFAFGHLCKNIDGKLCNAAKKDCHCVKHIPGEKCKRADGKGFCSRGAQDCNCMEDKRHPDTN